jgi:hypothetical protein
VLRNKYGENGSQRVTLDPNERLVFTDPSQQMAPKTAADKLRKTIDDVTTRSRMEGNENPFPRSTPTNPETPVKPASPVVAPKPVVDSSEIKKNLQGPMALPTGVAGDYRYNPGLHSRNEHGMTGWKASLKASGSTPEEVIANNKAIEQWLMTNHKAEFKPYSDDGGLFWRAETLGGSAKEMEEFSARASKDLGNILDTSFKYGDDPTTKVLAKEFAPGIRGRFDTQQTGLKGKASGPVIDTFKQAQKGPGKLPDGVSVPWNLTTKNILSGLGKQDQAISSTWGVRIAAIQDKIAKTTDPTELARLNESLQNEEKTLSDLLGKSFPGIYMRSGGVVYANNGALIEARAQGTDTVPAMLSPGEFVINRNAAQKHMPVLQAINSGHFDRGGLVNYLANGGIVAPRYYANAGIVSGGGGVSNGGGVLDSIMGQISALKDAFGSIKDVVPSLEGVANSLNTGLQSGAELLTNASNNILSSTSELRNMPTDIRITEQKQVNIAGVSQEWNKYEGDLLSIAGENSSQQLANNADRVSRRSEGQIDIG